MEDEMMQRLRYELVDSYDEEIELELEDRNLDELEGRQPVDKAAWEGPWIPAILATHLTPQKARILLMLALGKTRDDTELRRIFERY